MRLLVTGDRDWTDADAIRLCLLDLKPEVVIHGAAPGADSLADEVAKELGIERLSFPAKWKLYGRAAGPIRNQQMLDEGKPDTVVYFHHDLPSSKGTANMLKRARLADLPVYDGLVWGLW